MKFHVCIDRIVLDGLGWSASERRGFERSFATDLHEAIASQAGTPADAFIDRTVGFESLSIGRINTGDPRLAAAALASPLAALVLGERRFGTGKVGAN